MINQNLWENHYKKQKSILLYPDENLVRMLSHEINGLNMDGIKAIDIGCGSGRHVSLLRNFGIKHVTAADMSYNSVEMTSDHSGCFAVQCFNDKIPFKNDIFDIAVAWGSLHYADKNNTSLQIQEILRVLKKDGLLFGTLRSTFDSCLKKGKQLGNNTWITELSDLRNSIVSFFDEDELKNIFSDFSAFEFGIIERTLPGKLNERISHWYYRARK
ncbi:MAG: class I SAM-dependent methyltransferase [Spirochaetes bacterium]|nr:class I SAM-dependent methyltransferase [Spirochaetota bacterium]